MFYGFPKIILVNVRWVHLKLSEAHFNILIATGMPTKIIEQKIHTCSV